MFFYYKFFKFSPTTILFLVEKIFLSLGRVSRRRLWVRRERERVSVLCFGGWFVLLTTLCSSKILNDISIVALAKMHFFLLNQYFSEIIVFSELNWRLSFTKKEKNLVFQSFVLPVAIGRMMPCKTRNIKFMWIRDSPIN